jgi:oligosaccharide repeat unit polymerase
LKQQLGLNFAGGGFPPSILGGFFLEFGEAGILAGMFTVGFILQSAYLWMRKHPSDYSLIIYCFLFTYFIQSIRDGFLKDFFPIWFLLIITFLHVVITRTPTIRFTVKPADQSAR